MLKMATNAAIQTYLYKEDCEKILKRSIDFPTTFLGYKITKFHEETVGFLGDHFRLTIKYSKTNDNAAVQRTYFVKTPPQFNQNQLDYVREAGIFKKEVLLYQNLLAELLKINQFGPRCYFLRDNCIVLEDLDRKGYKMVSRLEYLDEDRCVSMLKTLGRFHASTIVYENRWGTTIAAKFKDEIKETCYSFIEGQPRHRWAVNVTKCITDLIELSHPKDCREICRKFQKFVLEEVPLLIEPSTRFRNVLTHDDLWCNNMMFNSQLECVFVDFQLVRYTPPGFDFLEALLLNLEPGYFERSLGKLVDVYYSSFKEELKKHGLVSDRFLSKTEFKVSLDYYRIAALTEAAMYGTQVYIPEELSDRIMSDFKHFSEFTFDDRSKYLVQEFQNNLRFRDRLNSILVPLVDALVNLI